jgi:hypothetical protein
MRVCRYANILLVALFRAFIDKRLLLATTLVQALHFNV